MAQIRVRITVPDSWSEAECDAFAAATKIDTENFALKVEANRQKLVLQNLVGSVN